MAGLEVTPRRPSSSSRRRSSPLVIRPRRMESSHTDWPYRSSSLSALGIATSSGRPSGTPMMLIPAPSATSRIGVPVRAERVFQGGSVGHRAKALALHRQRGGASGRLGGLPWVAVEAVPDHERRREHVAGAGGIDLAGLSGTDRVALAVHVQQRAGGARGHDGDRQALDPLGHELLVTPYILTAEKERLQPPQERTRRYPRVDHYLAAPTHRTQSALGVGAERGLGERAGQVDVDFGDHGGEKHGL